MGLSKADVRQLADHEFTSALRTVFPRLFQGPGRSECMCFPCGCAGGRCYRVMQVKSVQKAAQRGQPLFVCAVHDESGNGSRSSKHIREFARCMWTLRPHARIIWDWNCVEADVSRSIDATVWCGLRCTHYEVDGAQHFSTCMTSRDSADEDKDMMLNQAQVPLLCVLRLHFLDQENWCKYVNKHLQHPTAGVCYSKAYQQCLSGHVEEQSIIQL